MRQELASPGVEEELPGPTPWAGEEKVIVAISIDVSPRATGAKLRELVWKQRLEGEIIKWNLPVHCHREGFRLFKERRYRRGGLWGRLADWFGDRVVPIGGEVFEDLPRPTRPEDLKPIDVLLLSEPEKCCRVTRGEPAAGGGDRAGLGSGSIDDLDRRPEPPAVACSADQVDSDPAVSAAEVAVEADWPVGVADDEVGIAILIEVGGRGAETDTALLQAPAVARWCEL